MFKNFKGNLNLSNVAVMSTTCPHLEKDKINPWFESLALIAKFFAGYQLQWLAIDIMKNSLVLAKGISILSLENAYIALCGVIYSLCSLAIFFCNACFDHWKNLSDYFKHRDVRDSRKITAK
ncbi:MAG: hypothetical protein HZB76_04820 [Chlamydiae bacterium]|nr:hypothetical protein [Chlamydiota bacterium]